MISLLLVKRDPEGFLLLSASMTSGAECNYSVMRSQDNLGSWKNPEFVRKSKDAA